MRVLWISGREIGSDLAGTTEHYLATSMGENGAEVTLMSPGRYIGENYSHISLEKLKIPGLETLSSANEIHKKISGMDLNIFDVVIIDWRYVYPIRKIISELEKSWFIIDRGPPAYPGILKRFQKWYWKRAWEIAENSASGGFVVSEEHANFVEEYAGISLNHEILPAGTCQENTIIHKPDPMEKISLAYIGRIDKRRGLMSIEKLSSELEKQGLEFEINICGEGDIEKKIEKLSRRDNRLIYHGKIPQLEVGKILSICHVGIMTMPDLPIWRIASPLKLAEYLSSGLAIIGPRHPGNGSKIEEACILLTKNDWEVKSVSILSSLSSEDWGEIVDSARKYSKSLTWKGVSIRMINALRK